MVCGFWVFLFTSGLAVMISKGKPPVLPESRADEWDKLMQEDKPQATVFEGNCPFCGEPDLDIVGLKNHLLATCQAYDALSVREMWTSRSLVWDGKRWAEEGSLADSQNEQTS